MPYQCADNREQYTDNLWKINAFIESIQNTNFMIIGDWNANLRENGNSLFGATMLEFCNENNLIVSTKSLLPPKSYSHISTRKDNLFKTWIDHVVSSNDLHIAIDNIEILYNVSDDDHIPFIVHLNVDIIPKVTNETNDLVTKINWNNIKDSELQKYHKNTCEILEQIRLPTDALSCKNQKCSNESHRQDLTIFYNSITDALNIAGSHLNSKGNKGFVQRPGWTEYVSDLYDYSKTCRQHWLDSNETRQGPIHNNYVRSRARFKYALRFI